MARNSKGKTPAASVDGGSLPPPKKAKIVRKTSSAATSSSSSCGIPSVAATMVTPVPVSLTNHTLNAAHKLIDLAKSGGWDELFGLLDTRKELVNIRPEVREYSVLHQAAYHGQLDIVKTLLCKYGADISQLTKHGQSAIEVAREQGQAEMVELLSACLAQQGKESSGSTSLTPEKVGKPKACVTPIPALSADVISGAHVIIDHAKEGNWQKLYEMLDHQAELVNVRPSVREFSALHQAAYHDNKDALLTLINEYGADPSLTTGSGLSLLQVAVGQGSETIVEALAELPSAAASKAITAQEDETDDEFEMKQMKDGSWKVMLKAASSESLGPVTTAKAAPISVSEVEPRLATPAASPATVTSVKKRPAAAAPTTATPTKKGPPVDFIFPEADKCVLCRHEGTLWHAMLKKANQFYLIQLVEVNPDSYCVWSRWGKVDTDGQNESMHFVSPELAAAAFKGKFYEKTNNKWETRKSFKPFFAKYVYVPQPDIDDDMAASQSGGRLPVPVPPLSKDVVHQAHGLLDLAKAGSWAELLKTLDSNEGLVNVRPEVREFSALHQAVFQGNMEIVVRLIEEYGADVSQRTKFGKSVAQLAEDQGYREIAEKVNLQLAKTVSAARA